MYFIERYNFDSHEMLNMHAVVVAQSTKMVFWIGVRVYMKVFTYFSKIMMNWGKQHKNAAFSSQLKLRA